MVFLFYELGQSQISNAISPSFPVQIINDSRQDWIDWDKQFPEEMDNSIDIQRVDYFSDGKMLNATLWLPSCIPENYNTNCFEEFPLNSSLSQYNLKKVDISVQKLFSENMSLDQFTNMKVDSLHTGFFTIESLKNRTIGDKSFREVIYTSNFTDPINRYLETWTVHEGKSYVIRYAATVMNYQNYLRDVMHIIDSFDITNSSIAQNSMIESIDSKGSKYIEYTNSKLGIAASYPSNWQIEENDHSTALFPTTPGFITYGMYIELDNNNRTGMLSGIDYTVNFYRHGQLPYWTKQVENWNSPTSVRFVSIHDDYEGLLGESPGPFVLLSVDMATLGYPESYKVIFFAIKGEASDVYRRIGDYTNWALIPPPKMTMSITPNPLELRQGEEKEIEMQLKSDSEFQSLVYISAAEHPNIDLDYPSQGLQMSPFGFLAIPLHITTATETQARPYTVPFFINALFPTELALNNTSSSPFHTGTVGFEFPSIKTDTINQTTDLTILVHKGPDWNEHFTNFWTTYGGLIALVAGGFGGAFSGWIIGKFQKTNNKLDYHAKP